MHIRLKRARLVVVAFLLTIPLPVAPAFAGPTNVRPYCIQKVYDRIAKWDRRHVSTTARHGRDEHMAYAVIVMYLRGEIRAHCELGWTAGTMVKCECSRAAEQSFLRLSE